MQPSADPSLWWQTDILYHIYPRSFMDASGDGVGDLPGITRRLEYLARTLGVGAVWISPFYPSPMADFGYDISDYCNVHPLFGALGDFDALIAEAGRLGLRVLVDFVPNHTSIQHPWFAEARRSRDDPRRHWYVWAAPAPGGGPPNNWISAFGGPAWTLDPATGQYYLHSYLAEQPDLNWRCPGVEAAMLDVLRFWLGRGVAGFRIDAAHRILKDPLLRDNPPNPNPPLGVWRQGWLQLYEDYDAQLHLHDMRHPDVHGVYGRIRRLLDAYDPVNPRIAVGEVAPAPWAEWMAYYGPAGDGFHLPLNFELIKAPWRADVLRDLVASYEAALPPGAWPNYVLGNHDTARVASRLGPAQARVAAMLLLTLRGTPTLYYGEELGMPDIAVPPGRHQDPFGQRYPEKSRDRCRAPMPWADGPGRGFTTAAEPWLPLPAHTPSVEAQRADPASMLTLYRRLIALRQGSAALRTGRYAALPETPAQVYAYRRTAGSEEVIVALNFSDQPQSLRLPEAARVLLSTHPEREAAPGAGPLALRPNEGAVLRIG